jgi:large subunit ribosomal protein L21
LEFRRPAGFVQGVSGFLGRVIVFAIIQASGRQFRVEPGAIIAVDGHTGDAGTEVAFDQVLLVGKDADNVLSGTPFVVGARVVGVIDGTGKTRKVRVFKKKRRKQFRRTKGHRSLLTRVRITDIQAS